MLPQTNNLLWVWIVEEESQLQYVAMVSADKEVKEQLLEAGTMLLDPPSSLHDLLILLDRVECCLSRVEQSPTKSMQIALSPSSKALIADKLMRHSDVDVRVAVASCISEITRITAPDYPYDDDDQIKEVFQLIVSSFENLYDKSSRSYTKRTSILNTLAAVRSSVIMLDLNCDSLIVEMFHHFFKEIREYHPENVLPSMETIITLVLKESDHIGLDLMSPILASTQEDNEGVSATARKLGERVLKSCATMLITRLLQATKTVEISADDDYNKASASIGQETSGTSLEKNYTIATSEHVEDEIKSSSNTAAESMQVPSGTAMNVKHLKKTISLVEEEVAACGERVLRLKFEVEISKLLAKSATYMFCFLVMALLVVLFVK